jgi:hypothetical protein
MADDLAQNAVAERIVVAVERGGAVVGKGDFTRLSLGGSRSTQR